MNVVFLCFHSRNCLSFFSLCLLLFSSQFHYIVYQCTVFNVTLQPAQTGSKLLRCRSSTASTRDLRTCLRQSQKTLHRGYWGCTDTRLSGGSRSSSVTCFDFSRGSSPMWNECRSSCGFVIPLSGQSTVSIAGKEKFWNTKGAFTLCAVLRCMLCIIRNESD